MPELILERVCPYCRQLKPIGEFNFLKGRCVDCRKLKSLQNTAKLSKNRLTKALKKAVDANDLAACASGFRALFSVYGGEDGFVKRMKKHLLFLSEYQKALLQTRILSCLEKHQQMLNRHQDEMLELAIDDAEAQQAIGRVEYLG